MKSTVEVLKERGDRYGTFQGNAAISTSMKGIARKSPSWEDMDDVQREGLDMILHKIARILNGDPGYADNWTDIAGYAQLVETHVESEEYDGNPIPRLF